MKNNMTEKTPEEILAEAKAEAEKIIADAKAAAGEDLEAARQARAAADADREEAEKARAAAVAEMEAAFAQTAAIEQRKAEMAEEAPKPVQMVKIRLFKDNNKYKDDVFVAVNGQGFQIRRGEEVEVPDFVAEVLKQSLEQDQATSEMIETESSRFAAEAKARNL